MQISLYSIIVILFYTIGSLLYIFSIFKSRDLLNPLSNIMKKIVSYGLIVCMYLPFLICFILILKRKQWNNYNDFILVNSLWLLLFVTPMIIFRNSIFNYKGTTINLSEEDLMNYSEYDDEEGKKIKERAAKSEYNERKDMDRGIYS